MSAFLEEEMPHTAVGYSSQRQVTQSPSCRILFSYTMLMLSVKTNISINKNPELGSLQQKLKSISSVSAEVISCINSLLSYL